MAIQNAEQSSISNTGPWKKCLYVLESVTRVLEKYAHPLMLLGARIYVARVFWRSGQTKITNIQSTVDLFKSEYIPNWETNSKNLFGADLSWTVPDPAIAAKLSIAAELGLPVMLVLGLMGRFAGLGLLGMAATIELFIYPGTTEHYYWMLILGIIVTGGSGSFAIDYFFRRKFMTSR